MIYYKADKIKFSYENQTESILEDISFTIDSSSKIGLIGKNGSGKTTLLKLLLDELQPDTGHIYRTKKMNIGYLSQELRMPCGITCYDYLLMAKPALVELKKIIDKSEQYSSDDVVNAVLKYEELRGYEFENRLEKSIGKFEFSKEFLKRDISSLSGGEKSKLGLCRIMMNNPDILLLDEPTNHLDLEVIRWAEDYLTSIKTPFLTISHNRKFLDNTVNKIWEIDNKKLKQFSGNYSFYKREKEEEHHRKIHNYNQAQKKIKQLKKVYRERREWALSYQNQTGKEGYAPAFEMITNPAKSAMKRAKNIETRIKREIEEIEKPWIEKEKNIFFNPNSLKSKINLNVENISKIYGEKQVLQNVKFYLRNGEKLLIKGKNGTGKTTLFKILMEIVKAFEGTFKWNPRVKIGYYSQEFENLDFEKTMIEEITQGNTENQAKARIFLGSLGVRGDKVFQKIKYLSIGERSKAALAKLIISDANVYLLDEPINHLEITSREALEKALLKYNGSVIFVSHDRYFNEKIADRVIDLDKKRFSE